MDHPQIKRVVIAGGGTAGWVTAAALVKHLGALIDITLVESDAIGTVGVGESTIPTARTFHQFLGINEPVFVSATQASFKLGIEFENWRHIGDRYFHSFGSVGRSVLTADFQHFWLEARRQGFGGDFGDYSLELQAAASGKFATSPESPLAYAYHLDATAYARFLRGLAEPAGVTRVEGKIIDVAQNAESGLIDALVLDSGIRIEGDLFIDCTGFRALLIDGAMNAAFEDWSQWLSTDSAFAVQTESTGAPVPYTRAIAHEAGWRWRIPLQHRVGNGLVFSSADMSDDAARYEQGMRVRREVLGAEHVDAANARITASTADFQDFITRTAWGDVWSRPGLDRRARSVAVLSSLIALGHHEELAMHVRAAVTNGLTRDEIARVTNGGGKTVVAPNAETKNVLRPDVAYIMDDIMKDVINRGTATEAQAWGFRNVAGKQAFAGKTGTSRDGWFAGFTPEIVCVVYVGFDNGDDLGMKGSDSAMPIWADFMRAALDLHPEWNADWTMPAGIRRAEIDTRSGNEPSASL